MYPICGGNSVVECFLAKEDVASSSLVSRSIKDRWTFVQRSFIMQRYWLELASVSLVASALGEV